MGNTSLWLCNENPFCNSAVPTEVGAFTPGESFWSHSCPQPGAAAAVSISQCPAPPGRAAPFAPWWGSSPLAAAVGPGSAFWGNPRLRQLRLLHQPRAQPRRESGWRDTSDTCVAVSHFFPCTFSRLLCGSLGCNYLYLFNPAPRARLYAFAPAACCCVQPDQMPMPNCTNSKAAAGQRLWLIFNLC